MAIKECDPHKQGKVYFRIICINEDGEVFPLGDLENGVSAKKDTVTRIDNSGAYELHFDIRRSDTTSAATEHSRFLPVLRPHE